MDNPPEPMRSPPPAILTVLPDLLDKPPRDGVLNYLGPPPALPTLTRHEEYNSDVVLYSIRNLTLAEFISELQTFAGVPEKHGQAG